MCLNRPKDRHPQIDENRRRVRVTAGQETERQRERERDRHTHAQQRTNEDKWETGRTD